jgi:hypothetical protein
MNNSIFITLFVIIYPDFFHNPELPLKSEILSPEILDPKILDPEILDRKNVTQKFSDDLFFLHALASNTTLRKLTILQIYRFYLNNMNAPINFVIIPKMCAR